MINHGTVESTEKPEALVMDDYSVWVASDITETEKTIGDGESQKGYQYTLIQYTKDEYIRAVSDSNKSLEGQMLETQDTIADIYEQLLTAASI